MLSIFALDPEICSNLEWFRYCVEHCQPSQGRAIADLPPGEWCRQALARIEKSIFERSLGPIKAQSLKNRLKRVRDRLVHRPDTNWNYMEELWLPNAEQEHSREPFAAIVSPQYADADNNDNKYHPDDINESIAAWNTPSGLRITRSPNALVAAIIPALIVAKEIHFIDRGFNIDANSLYTRNYKSIIEKLASRTDIFPCITINCCPDSDISPSYFANELKQIYENSIPSGSVMKCLMWKVNDGELGRGNHPFHNRYIITDYMGIKLGYGTDSSTNQTESPDTIQCLDSCLFQTLLNDCKRKTHPLVHIRAGGEIFITGTKL